MQSAATWTFVKVEQKVGKICIQSHNHINCMNSLALRPVDGGGGAIDKKPKFRDSSMWFEFKVPIFN